MIHKTDAEAADGWLSPETWNAIQRSMPICCVDFFPVYLDPAAGEVLRVGLISRPFPDPDRTTHVWCQVGGRVRFGETLRAGLVRHAYDTFTFDSEADAAAVIDFDVLRYPVVSEWFPPKLGLRTISPRPSTRLAAIPASTLSAPVMRQRCRRTCPCDPGAPTKRRRSRGSTSTNSAPSTCGPAVSVWCGGWSRRSTGGLYRIAHNWHMVCGWSTIGSWSH